MITKFIPLNKHILCDVKVPVNNENHTGIIRSTKPRVPEVLNATVLCVNSKNTALRKGDQVIIPFSHSGYKFRDEEDNSEFIIQEDDILGVFDANNDTSDVGCTSVGRQA